MSNIQKSTVDDVTIFIKTFKRDDTCSRLIDSIRKFYPEQPIIVINDGNETVWEDANMQTVVFDSDIGVSRGRNEALRMITTKYAVQCDDDFIFTNHTDLQRWKDLMVANDMDILGAEIGAWKLGKYRKFSEGWQISYNNKHDVENGIYFADFCLQFLMLDVEKVLSGGGWDEELQMCEHVAFFFTMSQVNSLRIGATKEVKAQHQRNSSNQKAYDVIRKGKQKSTLNGAFKKYNIFEGSRKGNHSNVKRLRNRKHRRR